MIFFSEIYNFQRPESQWIIGVILMISLVRFFSSSCPVSQIFLTPVRPESHGRQIANSLSRVIDPSSDSSLHFSFVCYYYSRLHRRFHLLLLIRTSSIKTPDVFGDGKIRKRTGRRGTGSDTYPVIVQQPI